MPIKGISDRPRLPRLGKIRLGVKVEPEGRASYPRAVDYFVVPPEVQAVVGKEPRSLSIVFPTEDENQWASHFYRAYASSRGLVCRGDGEVATRLVDLEASVRKDTGELPQDLHPRYWALANRDSQKVAYQQIQCPPDSCPQSLSGHCRPVMTLQFMLPEVPGLGIWQLDTSSWNSIRNVLSVIQLVRGLVGRISLIPLTLSLVPLEVQPEGTRKTVHVLQLTAPYKLADLFHYAELPRGHALLPEPDQEPPDDLFPEEEPTAPPVETTVKSFALEDDTAQRVKAWQAIVKLVDSKVATSRQVVLWLHKEAGITIVMQQVEGDTPPGVIPTSTLTRLHDALGQYQVRLGGESNG